MSALPLATSVAQAEQRWFAALFCPTLAYIRPAASGGGWQVHAADGTLLGLFSSRDVALVAARRRDFDAVTAH